MYFKIYLISTPVLKCFVTDLTDTHSESAKIGLGTAAVLAVVVAALITITITMR